MTSSRLNVAVVATWLAALALAFTAFLGCTSSATTASEDAGLVGDVVCDHPDQPVYSAPAQALDANGCHGLDDSGASYPPDSSVTLPQCTVFHSAEECDCLISSQPDADGGVAYLWECRI